MNAAQVDKLPLKNLMGPKSRYMHCSGVVHQTWLQMQKPKFYHNKIFRDKCINVLVDYDEKQLLYMSVENIHHT